MSLIALNAQHSVPASLINEAKTALSHFPLLDQTEINLKFKKNLGKSTMKAQPKFWSLLGSKKNRKYVILISEKIKITDKVFLTKDIPENIMIGWIGHELGHIMDYKNRSSLNLIWFGIRYSLSGTFVKEAERIADTFAVEHDMGSYILETKNFILENAEIDEKYKSRIRKFYLSPETILELINEKSADETSKL